MKSLRVGFLSASILFAFFTGVVSAGYEPPLEVSREEIVKISNSVLAMPDIKVKSREEVFRIRVLGMD